MISYEYDDNILVEIVSNQTDEIKYYYYYNDKNELIEKKGFMKTKGIRELVYHHQFEYKNGLITKDADIFYIEKSIKRYTYNEKGDNIRYKSTRQITVDGVTSEAIYSSISEFEYNDKGDWIKKETEAYSIWLVGEMSFVATRDIVYY